MKLKFKAGEKGVAGWLFTGNFQKARKADIGTNINSVRRVTPP